MEHSLLYQVLFAVALVAPVFPGLCVVFSVVRSRHLGRTLAWAVVFVGTLVANPLAQVWLLESTDWDRGLAMAQQAKEQSIKGMGPAEVRKIHGDPSYTYLLGTGTLVWGYKQVPGYWLGSHFQVFLEQDVVTGFQANDD
jgi:hypothetical protein